MRPTLLPTILALMAAGMFSSAPAQGQASRTWVSGVGDDANPCSRTAPCKTFAGAYSKTAAGGEIDALDPGGFGTVTLSKSLTLDGGGGQVASILATLTNGITIQAGVNDVVTLRNLRIQGLKNAGSGGLNGVRFLSGAALNIANCAIDAFNGYGVDFEPNATSRLAITNTVLTNNGDASSGGGILDQPQTVNGTSYVLIDDTVIADGGIGVQINGGGGGSPDYVTITNTRIAENQLQGILATTNSSGIKLMLDGVKSVNNGMSGTGEGLRVVGGAATAYFTRSTFTGNFTQGVVSASGGLLFSYGDNQNDMNPGGAGSAATSAPHY